MQRTIASIIVIFHLVFSAKAQWTTSGSNIYYSSGKVGIGTTAPTGTLHLAGDFELAAPSTGFSAYKTNTNGGFYKSSPGGSGAFSQTNNLIIQGYTDGTNARGIYMATGATPLERLKIDIDGNFSISNTRTVKITSAVPTSSGMLFDVINFNAAEYDAVFELYNNSPNDFSIGLRKSRSSTVGTYTSVQTGDGIGSITAMGDDGTQFTRSSQIAMTVASAPSAGIVPGTMKFITANTSGVLTTALTINSDQTSGFANKVGIGTTTPQTMLDLGELRLGTLSSFPAEGSVSEGVWGNYIIGGLVNPATRCLRLGVSNDFYTRAEIFFDNGNRADGTISFKTANGNGGAQTRVFVNGAGNVGIGTTSPDALLAVNGQVHAQEVKVSTTVPGPDYVFEKDYKMPSLDSVKSYIDQNKHLPEIPSAREMEKNGIQLGEMNMLLLKKIEELTLHIIKQEERIKALEEKNKR